MKVFTYVESVISLGDTSLSAFWTALPSCYLFVNQLLQQGTYTHTYTYIHTNTHTIITYISTYIHTFVHALTLKF